LHVRLASDALARGSFTASGFMRKIPFIFSWLIGAGVVVWGGFLPNPYLQATVALTPPHPFPLSGVIGVVVLVTIEVAVLYAVFRPMSFQFKAWGRSTVAFAVASAFLAYGALGAMHAPPFMFAYIWWLVGVAVVLAVTMLASIIIRVYLGPNKTLDAPTPARHAAD
jgi:hypothetical protein